MSHDALELGPADLLQLSQHGIAKAEAARQLALLREPVRYRTLDRPCRIGEGIERIDDSRARSLCARAAHAAAAGRVTAFIPASGAATRMFHDLLHYEVLGDQAARRWQSDLASGVAAALPVSAFMAGLSRFAFAEDLADRLGCRLAELASRDLHVLLEALLAPGGLGYAHRPKGLLAFHRYPDRARTPFEEHLHEAAVLVRDARGVCRLEFTVSAEHRDLFAALLGARKQDLEARLDVHFEVALSTQSAATDTLALNRTGAPFRDPDGRLLLRPSGHGALLGNLERLGADLVFIKNIDNVAVEDWKSATYEHARRLLGRLLEIEQQAQALAARLDDPDDAGATAEALEFAREVFGHAIAAGPRARAELASTLDRPLRVCGMVPNAGEPGGGPFFVRDASGHVARQIVESAEVDMDSPTQKQVWRSSTHFNPVFLACSLRDRHGRPHVLESFADASAAMVARKSAGGETLLALERPGLWNGGMARWNTVFVEVPAATFNPVKTVLDLLRREHQPQ
jgi:hypothetical protein